MQIDINGVHTYNHDLCSTCAKDNDECVFKKALSNYHNGGSSMPLSLMLTDCPEYIRTENRNGIILSEIGIADGPYVRFNTEERNNE